jgi:hypothetical protein
MKGFLMTNPSHYLTVFLSFMTKTFVIGFFLKTTWFDFFTEGGACVPFFAIFDKADLF